MTTAPVDIKIKAIDRFSRIFKKGERGLARLSGAARRVSSNFQMVSSKIGGFRKKLDGANAAVMGVGKTMSVGATLPVLGLGASIIRTASNFEKSMNKVKAKTGETGEGFTKMRDLAKELGESTAFSASQAAEAMAFLGMAGFDTNKILKSTPALLDLAASAGAGLPETADIVSNIMSGFGIDASESRRMADILATVTSSANVDLQMLAESMKFMGPVAKDFGMSIEEAGAAAGLLGNIGIQGTMAGTAMRRMMSILTAPTDAAAGALEDLGVKVADSRGNIRSFNDIMIDLGTGLGKLPQKAKLEKLNKVFGLLGISAASALGKSVESGEFEKFVNSLKNVEGAAKKQAETMNSGAAGGMKKLASAAEGLQIEIGDSGILKTFTELIKEITKFTKEMSKTSPKMMRIAATVGILGAAVGPLLIGLGSLGIGASLLVRAMMPLLSIMFTLGGPLIWLAVLVGALAIAFLTMDDPLDLLRYLFWELKNLGKWLKDHFMALPEMIEKAWSTMLKKMSELKDGFSITAELKDMVSWIKENFLKLPEWIEEKWSKTIEKITSLKDSFGGFFGSIFGSDKGELEVSATKNINQLKTPGMAAAKIVRPTAPIAPINTERAGETNTLNVKFDNPPPGIQVVPTRNKKTRINIDAGLQAAGGL